MESVLEDGEISAGGAFFSGLKRGSDFVSDDPSGQWIIMTEKQQTGQAPVLGAGTHPRHPWTCPGGHGEPHLNYRALNDNPDRSGPDMSCPEQRVHVTYGETDRRTGETSWNQYAPESSLYGHGDAHLYVDGAAEAGTSGLDYSQQNQLGTDFYASAWDQAPPTGGLAYNGSWQVNGSQWHDGTAVSYSNHSVRGPGQEGQVYAYESVGQEAFHGNEQATYSSWDWSGSADSIKAPATPIAANEPPDTAPSGLLNVSEPTLTRASESNDEPPRKGFKKPDKTRLVLGKNKPIVQANFLPKLSSGGITKPRPKKAESKYEAEKRKYQSRMND